MRKSGAGEVTDHRNVAFQGLQLDGEGNGRYFQAALVLEQLSYPQVENVLDHEEHIEFRIDDGGGVVDRVQTLQELGDRGGVGRQSTRHESLDLISQPLSWEGQSRNWRKKNMVSIFFEGAFL
jgi:hypothetical protein